MKSRGLSVFGLTQGESVPSTRFRWSQYVDDLDSFGFSVSSLHSSFGAYAPALKIVRAAWLMATLAESLARSLRARRCDIVFLQRNLIATLHTWEPLLKRPVVFDVDDAIFLGRRGDSANRIARSASITICGNNFLADHFSNYGEVIVLPTAVDTNRFVPATSMSHHRQVIGWSGSSSGLKYLYGIEDAIFILLNKYPEAILKVVCDRPPVFRKLPVNRLEYELWSAEREVAALQEFTVGIMPLENDLWARGKCSFKMLTYMAVGIPVVVSPVGMNADVLLQGLSGFGARDIGDWVDSISCIFEKPTMASEMGMTGRRIIEASYARNVVAPKLARLLRSQL
jgi:glycosyltransferase involved in cell wall biosynthesis